ncbi:MAG: hypothetical protein OMM_06639 [Candidatus Magnetoglobus multicellularis str. Araruama]|uniref:Uncharacterized protein n=1 Tax=Candidatus Magnetoglobus multicellularis str. Araruama TaxID=890399 RepID=A0A1V1PGQ5_9BACT|nr:MAG: hypothetical protein OMM_06639 [Candidatus Magnetoglobus multicellularis str. Araruama]
MKDSDIITKDIAFLSHGSKIDSIKYTVKNNVLICQESKRFLLPPTLLSLFFGPCASLAIYFSLINLSQEPFFC